MCILKMRVDRKLNSKKNIEVKEDEKNNRIFKR